MTARFIIRYIYHLNLYFISYLNQYKISSLTIVNGVIISIRTSTFDSKTKVDKRTHTNIHYAKLEQSSKKCKYCW